MKFYDSVGTYSIVHHRNGTASVYHRLAVYPLKKIKVGTYKTLNRAKIALSKYCGGMPKEKRRKQEV